MREHSIKIDDESYKEICKLAAIEKRTKKAIIYFSVTHYSQRLRNKKER